MSSRRKPGTSSLKKAQSNRTKNPSRASAQNRIQNPARGVVAAAIGSITGGSALDPGAAVASGGGAVSGDEACATKGFSAPTAAVVTPIAVGDAAIAGPP